MKVCALRFNIYLAIVAAFALVCGCQTGKPKEKLSALRIHVETNPTSTGTSQTVSVLRSEPVLVTVENDPILTEANVINARIIESPGGFAVEVRFDETGSWILEQNTAANVGRHFAIFGQWGDKLINGRWLAAPLITHRIGNNVLAFTPDASRDEADQLVLGLNNVAKNTLKAQLVK
jgi:preprotein translocase subunit SecD